MRHRPKPDESLIGVFVEDVITGGRSAVKMERYELRSLSDINTQLARSFFENMAFDEELQAKSIVL